MNVRYYIDPKTGLPHIYNHNVDESEVEDVLINPGEDWRGRNQSRVAIGQTQAGRYLQVIYTPAPQPDSVFVMTAYDLRGKPLAVPKRRERSRRFGTHTNDARGGEVDDETEPIPAWVGRKTNPGRDCIL